MQEEIWKFVINYNNYQISNYGRLKSKQRIIKGCKKKGYVIYALSKNKKYKNFFAHQLVGIHFILNPENKKEVNHIGEKD